MLALAAVYFAAGKLGLRLAFVNASATAVWPPTGIALAAFLILGRGVWPAILVGAFLVNVTTAGSVWTSLGVACGNTLEGLVGSWLVNRYAHGRHAFDRAGDVILFALLGGAASTCLSATIGVLSLMLGGLAPWPDFGRIWLTWWLGDAGGDLVVVPLLLLWSANLKVAWSLPLVLEGAALALAATLIGLIAFGALSPQLVTYPLEFLLLPVLIWAAFRFGRRGAALGVAVVYAIAVHGTLQGFGPFARVSRNESLLLLQAYTCVTSLTTLILATVVAERRRVEQRLRRLAVSDALTGLGNYRLLMAELEREIQRSGRTERPFSVLFLDLNGLKRINDRHGHLVGSRALCRVADALRKCCRTIDTGARYGGDEFAVILPESDERAAGQLLHRLTGMLASDREEPALSVSAGIAVYPRDGAVAGDLLAAADRAQYAVKTRSRSSLVEAGRREHDDGGAHTG